MLIRVFLHSYTHSFILSIFYEYKYCVKARQYKKSCYHEWVYSLKEEAAKQVL